MFHPEKPPEDRVPARNGSKRSGGSFGERLRSRDPGALEELFNLHFDSVYGRVRAFVSTPQEAEDLTADIFRGIHAALPTLDPATRIEPWILEMAMDRIREHSASAPGAGIVTEANRLPVADLSDPENGGREERLRQAVYRLPLGLRSVLFLRVYDALQFDAIARILELTPAEARGRYAAAVSILRESLARGDG